MSKIGTGFSRLLFFFTSSLFLFSCKSEKQNKNLNEEINYPQRIVSLSPSSTEILCAVGAYNQLVARSDFSDYPPEVLDIPLVGGFDGKNLSLEKILSFEPDFVYLTSGMHDYLAPMLKARKIRYFISTDASINGIISEIHEIGKITGHESNALELCDKIKKNCFTDEYTEKKTVYFEIWSPPYMSIGNLSYLSELIEISGGINIFNELKEAYPIVSDEAIIIKNPEIIIIPNQNQIELEQIKNRKGWENISAIKNNRIYFVDADLISRPGPRIIESVSILRSCIHGENN